MTDPAREALADLADAVEASAYNKRSHGRGGLSLNEKEALIRARIVLHRPKPKYEAGPVPGAMF